MLTRRGFAACALCAISGFSATAADAQSTSTPGLKRTILQRVDGPAPGYETIMVTVEIEPGAMVARHTHPGVESSFVIEGETELSVDGQAPRTFRAGDTFQIPTGVPHSGKNGDKPTRLSEVYVLEKGKPLASPA